MFFFFTLELGDKSALTSLLTIEFHNNSWPIENNASLTAAKAFVISRETRTALLV
jgi:hypothetical protein